jgi:hypothetical protein
MTNLGENHINSPNAVDSLQTPAPLAERFTREPPALTELESFGSPEQTVNFQRKYEARGVIRARSGHEGRVANHVSELGLVN